MANQISQCAKPETAEGLQSDGAVGQGVLGHLFDQRGELLPHQYLKPFQTRRLTQVSMLFYHAVFG